MILFHRLRQRHAPHSHAHLHAHRDADPSAFRAHLEHRRPGAALGRWLAGDDGDGRHAGAADAGFRDRLLERAAAQLDLGAGQRELLADLLAQLRRQRRALKAATRGPELAALLAGDNFARDDAQRLFDQRLDALRAAGPALVAAFGDFFDALDFEQQQALRFVQRRLRQRHPQDGR